MDTGIKNNNTGVRNLETAMGSTDISSIGDGSVTGAIDSLNEHLTDGIGGTTDTFRFGTDNGEYGYIKKVGGADTFFPFKSKPYYDVMLNFYNTTYYFIGFIDADKEIPISIQFAYSETQTNIAFCDLKISHNQLSHSFTITYTKACTRYLGNASQHFNANQSETLSTFYLNAYWWKQSSNYVKSDDPYYVVFD